jgi:hypothetical protein
VHGLSAEVGDERAGGERPSGGREHGRDLPAEPTPRARDHHGQGHRHRAVPGDQGDLNTLGALGARGEIRAECGDVEEFRRDDLDKAERGARGGGDQDGGDVAHGAHGMEDFNSAWS